MSDTRHRLIHDIPLAELTRLLALPFAEGGSIRYITTDSREVEAGDLFVSLARDPRASLKHLSEAAMRGAITLGAGAELDVADAAGALLSIAAHCKCSLPRLGYTVTITGSVGKTTTKEFLAAILSEKYRTHATDANRNNRIGVPLTLLTAPEDTEALVLELGMNHPGEISELSRCVRPDVAVITNIGSSHIGNLGSREKIAEAKLEILDGMRGGVLLCEHGEPLLSSAPGRVTFSLSEDGASYGLHRREEGTYLFRTPEGGSARICFPYGEAHLLSDLVAAAAAAHLCGMTPDEIAAGVCRIGGSALRHRITDCGRYSVLNDSYNSSYESASAALAMLCSRPAPIRSALLGDILELGEHSQDIHVRLGGRAAALGIDKLYLVGEHREATSEGARRGGMSAERIFILDKTDNFRDTATIIKGMLSEGELLLVKGSHASELYRVAEILEGGKND